MNPTNGSPPSAPLPSAVGPTPFGKYLLLDLVGRGSVAEVYRARPRHSQQVLAIKCLRPQLVRDARFVDAFVREAKVAVMLDCDAIVRTLELGRIDGRYFVAMEYLSGKTLAQLLRRCQETNQRIPVSHAVYLAMKIAQGLEYAHSRCDGELGLGIVNGDVSPSNLRISYQGDVKVIDFGFGQSIAKFAPELELLKTKYSYQSPEQIEGAPLDPRSDVFGVGALLHELLTGKKLFLDPAVRRTEVAAPSRLNRRVPEALDQICLRSLQRPPEARFGSAGQLVEALAQVLANQPCSRDDLGEFVRIAFRQDCQRERAKLEALLGHPTPESLPAIRDSSLHEIPLPPLRPSDLELERSGTTRPPNAARRGVVRWLRRLFG